MITDSDEAFRILDTYVKAANELSEAVKRDIISGGIISDDTGIKLTKLHHATIAAADLLGVFDGTGTQ